MIFRLSDRPSWPSLAAADLTSNTTCAVRFRSLFRSLLTLRSMVYDALAKFDRIYDLQADGRVFDTPEDLWSESEQALLHRGRR